MKKLKILIAVCLVATIANAADISTTTGLDRNTPWITVLDQIDHNTTVAAAVAARMAVSGVVLGSNVSTFLGTPSSANLKAAITDETGSGLAVFATSPAMTTQVVTGGLTASGSGANTFAGSTGTFITSTGLTTISGGLAGSTQALSGAGAVNVTTVVTKLTTTGAAQALTLANGTDGQIKVIVHDVDGGSAVLTPTTKTGFTTITFTAVGESATLVYVTTRGWIILALNGAVAA